MTFPGDLVPELVDSFWGQLALHLGYQSREIEDCKLTHPHVSCRSCHGSGSVAAQPRSSPAALRTPPNRGSGHNFSVARQPPSFKRDGTSSGEGHKAQPSGERPRTPSGGSGSSAMDRLGGGGMSSAPSGSGQSGGRSATRPSTGGGASSASPGGSSSSPGIRIDAIIKPGGPTPGQGQSPGLR